jgi:BirA family biotin operon repressor/biotin-[acetyl-CoA-carboxylase] ligase
MTAAPTAPATPAPPVRWHAEALWEQLEPLWPGLSVEVLAETDSTNTRLLERVRAAPAGEAQACLLVAERQTAGRGRQGKPWQAQPGASLTFSLALPLAPRDWSGLSLAVGVALAEALQPVHTGQPTPSPWLALKWPNDLWLQTAPGQGRKLGGILVETVAAADGQRWCVVGVGLNVLPQALDTPTVLSSGYACVQELVAGASAPHTLAAVAAPLLRALVAFQTQGFGPLVPAFARRDLLLGQPLRTTDLDGSTTLQGVGAGVDAGGALQVLAAGQLQAVVSGEVSVRLQDSASSVAADAGARPC